jgi:pyrroline-5-carboxylate reductase
MQILIIGGGNMGLTYAQSLVRSHITNKENLMILTRTLEKANDLRQKNVGKVFNNAAECVPQADLIILAVKPQDSGVLFEMIKDHVHPQQVFLSIMAGIKINKICKTLNVSKVVRAMPNLPAQIGMGMTTFISSDEVTRLELVMVQNLLSTTGKTLYVENEELVDASTAISGSGPAYIYYMMEAFMKAAKGMGFNESEAEMLVSQTFNGALDLYNKADFSCSEWIAKVSSKGGTTEAAIKSFNGNDLNLNFVDGVNAAFERAKEMGK